MARRMKEVLYHRGLGFLMIRKCATTSIKVAVLEGMGLERQRSIHNDKRLKYCATADADGLIKLVAVIRNPFERIVSAWRNKMHDQSDHPGADRFKELGINPGCSFPAFIEQITPVINREAHIRPQARQLPKRVAYMLRFESLDVDWPLLRERHAWLPDIGRFNTSSREDYRRYYTDATWQAVQALYSADVRLHEQLGKRAAGSLDDARWIT